jgi:hypothetical protein
VPNTAFHQTDRTPTLVKNHANNPFFKRVRILPQKINTQQQTQQYPITNPTEEREPFSGEPSRGATAEPIAAAGGMYVPGFGADGRRGPFSGEPSRFVTADGNIFEQGGTVYRGWKHLQAHLQ